MLVSGQENDSMIPKKAPLAKILIIDDERGPRESLRILLKNQYEVVLAQTVDEGVEFLRRDHFDTVILDIKMPGKSGIDGLREIREIDSEVSIVMLTGFGALETAQEALRLGANDYLKKPFDATEMQEAARKHVRATRFRRRKVAASLELQELNRRLVDEMGEKSRMASLGQASAEFVHDLRNPLSIVLGYVSLLAGQLAKAKDTVTDQATDTYSYLEIIEKNVRRCHELAQMWKSLGKKDPARMKPIRISDTLHDIIRGAETVARERNAVIEENIQANGCTVMADDIQIFRAVSNLVVNAIHALPEKGGRVLVSCTREADSVEVAVEDNGCGIPPEKLTTIFHPYFSSKEIDDGIGLGLFIAKRVVEDHEGSIDVKSKPEQGTRFRIQLPASCN